MVDESVLALVRAHMRSVKVASAQDKVYKEECVFSFDSPESPAGLFINLTTFQVGVPVAGPMGATAAHSTHSAGHG